MTRRTRQEKDDALLKQMRLEERRRKPVKIRGVQFVHHNGLNYQYRCKHASPMIGGAATLKECIVKRNEAIKKRVGPFILSEMPWPKMDMVELIRKLFYEDEGKIYWNVAYITPRKICFAGDRADKEFKYAQVKVMGRSLMAHNVVWALVHGEWFTNLKHKDKNPLNNRAENLY